jgi:hypothetical protein
LAWLISVSMAIAPVSAVGFGQAGASDSGGLLASNCSDESQPLPPRPVLTRSTFSAKAPTAPGAHKPTVKKKTIARKKTISSKPRKAAPAKPGVTKPAVKKAPHKAAPKKPGAHKPRKVVKKRNVASKMGKKGPSAGRGNAPLERATFGSPICADRAPVMQAFGLDDAASPLGDEFAQAINDALSPQDTTFTDGNFGQNPFNSFGGTRSSTFPTVPGISGGGGGGGTNSGGGGNNGGGNNGGGENGGGNNGGGNNGGGNNGGGNNGGGDNGGGNNGGGGENPPIPAVPEPASWIMMILGFGLAGFVLRRRRPSEQQQHI